MASNERVIQPTVGRVVLYWPAKGEPVNVRGEQPFSATVCYVHNERLVNLVIADHDGNSYGRRSVKLVQPGDTDPDDRFCRWMPFQVGQATASHDVMHRIEQLEEAASKRRDEANAKGRKEEIQPAPIDPPIDPPIEVKA